jgi:CheY-like chemotaxis protein
MQHGVQVLVVDDDADIRKAFCDYLGWLGFSSAVCANGEEALLFLEHTPVNLILLDLQMPIMTGEEFLKAKQGRPEIRDIPVIVVTAVHSAPKVMIGVQKVLRKPLDMEELIREMRLFCRVA